MPETQIPTNRSEHDKANFQLTKEQLAYLKRHSTFYKGTFTRQPIDEHMKEIWIAIENVN